MLALNKREQKPAHEHVDISAKLAAVGLLEHLPSEVWPPMNAVRELNSGARVLGLGRATSRLAFDLVQRGLALST